MINKFQKQKEIIENNKIIRNKSYLVPQQLNYLKREEEQQRLEKKRLSDKQINKYVHASHVEV